MPEMVESSTYLFADDANIFREIREEKDEKMLQADLDNLLILYVLIKGQIFIYKYSYVFFSVRLF
jgi:hypothetical protein